MSYKFLETIRYYIRCLIKQIQEFIRNFSKEHSKKNDPETESYNRANTSISILQDILNTFNINASPDQDPKKTLPETIIVYQDQNELKESEDDFEMIENEV